MLLIFGMESPKFKPLVEARICELECNCAFTNKVIIHNNVFAMLMLHWIDRHISSTDIVILKTNRIVKDNLQVIQQLSNPDSFRNSITKCAIFNHSGRLRDCELLFRSSGNEVGLKIH